MSGSQGSLYFAHGDGQAVGTSSGVEKAELLSRLDNPFGKMFRINPLTGEGYADNPFFDGNVNSIESKIINYGLRNPWRYALHPNTDEPFIGDVGQASWEEINQGEGEFFGWSLYEGGNGVNSRAETSNAFNDLYDAFEDIAVAPIYAESHTDGTSAIVVGDFYTGTVLPDVYEGALFFANFSTNEIKALVFDEQGNPDSAIPFADFSGRGLSYMSMGPDGNLYFADILDGEVGYFFNASAPNTPPNAVDDTFVTNEDVAFTTGNVLTNDSDPNGDSVVVSSVNINSTQGVVTNNGDGTFGYDPNGVFDFLNAGETGADSFGYTISDGNGGFDTATVMVTINGVDDPIPGAPNAVNDVFTTDEDTAFTTGNVLTNDSDPDGDPIVISNVDISGTQGIVIDNDDGTFGYDPNNAFDSLNLGETDTDSFSYTISDGNGGFDTAIVTVTIDGVDDGPGGPAFTIEAEDIIDVSGYRIENDSDASGGQMLSLRGQGASEVGTATFTFTGPEGSYNVIIGSFDESDGNASIDFFQGNNLIGTANLNQNPGGAGASPTSKVEKIVASSLLITPGTNFTVQGNEDSGEHARFDFIRFEIIDGPSNTPPVAVDDTFSTDEDTAFTTGDVLGNDTDADGDSLTVTDLDTTGTLGQVTDNGDGTFSYDPNGQFESLNAGDSATDSFAYTVSDGNGGLDMATVTVTIDGVDDEVSGSPPVAVDDVFSTDEDTAFTTGDVLSNDTDADGDSLTVTDLDTTGTLGQVTDNGDGTFSYDPNGQFESLNAGDSATDNFAYTVSDGMVVWIWRPSQ